MELGHLLAVERAEVFYFPFFFFKGTLVCFPPPLCWAPGGYRPCQHRGIPPSAFGTETVRNQSRPRTKRSEHVPHPRSDTHTHALVRTPVATCTSRLLPAWLARQLQDGVDVVGNLLEPALIGIGCLYRHRHRRCHALLRELRLQYHHKCQRVACHVG